MKIIPTLFNMITKAPPEVLTTLLDSHHEWFKNCRIASERGCRLGIGHSKFLEHRLFSQITRR
ncbi:MAG: hypothetical protein MJZ56_02325 [Bacteroidales bacterium]|nr:hypothetical protein [Bacteroidales bacterium]